VVKAVLPDALPSRAAATIAVGPGAFGRIGPVDAFLEGRRAFGVAGFLALLRSKSALPRLTGNEKPGQCEKDNDSGCAHCFLPSIPNATTCLAPKRQSTVQGPAAGNILVREPRPEKPDDGGVLLTPSLVA